MKKKSMYVLLMAAFFLIFASLAVQCTNTQTGETTKQTSPATAAKQMIISGKIAIGYNNFYKIRGKMPPEVFTILNPEPKILDEYIKSGKIVDINVQVVTGDNINILKIDGKEYP